jgi:ABC-type polar amino acid transport system ATPase subunit
MSDPIVRVEGLHKSFGHLKVIQGVDMEVQRGEVVVIFGRSGSGKSTLLRCVNMIEDPTEGTIEVSGVRLGGGHRTRRKRQQIRQLRLRTGMVFQQFNLFPNMTVLDNIMCGPMCAGAGTEAVVRKRALDLLDRVGLSDKAGEHPIRLSGGQQQRVALVRALCTQPELLLLDEITAALDPELVGDVLTIVRDLAEAGTTMVLATHEMSFARDVATTVCFLDGGRVLEQGPPAELLVAPREERTRQFLRRILPPSG